MVTFPDDQVHHVHLGHHNKKVGFFELSQWRGTPTCKGALGAWAVSEDLARRFSSLQGGRVQLRSASLPLLRPTR